MTKKKHKQTKAELQAGAANLAQYNKKVAEGESPPGALKHGAFSKQIHRRYSDGRYKEAKRLNTVMNGLVEDLGGQSELTAAQSLLLNNIRSKLIVLFQIGAFVDEQETIINEKGELLPCLGRGYTTYAEALRRDLEALFAIKKKPAIQSYEKTLRALQGGKTQ